MSEIIGKIIHIGKTENVGSAGTFKKRLLVLETLEQYSQKIPIDFVQDKCDILDKYNLSEEVKVSINIRGNEYQGKYYVSLNGWRIEKSQSSPNNGNAFPEAPSFNEEDKDDLPW